MRYRVRCGDCLEPLSRRIPDLESVERLRARHRRLTACPCSGLLVAPEKPAERVA